MSRVEIRNRYLELKSEYETRRDSLRRRLIMASMLRLAVFAGGIILTILAFRSGTIAGITVLVLFMSAFLLMIRYYLHLSDEIAFYCNLVSINESELKAFSGDYSVFDGYHKWKDPAHDFSEDTDLFGDNSVFSYLNRTVTGYGREMLAARISQPYLYRNMVLQTQEAIKELAPKISWRQEFMARGLGRPLQLKDVEGIKEWLTGKETCFSPGIFKAVIWLLPGTALSLLALAVTGIVPFSVFSFIFILNLILTGFFLKTSNRIHAVVSRKYLTLSSFGDLISLFGKENFSSGILREASGQLISGEHSATARIKKLGKIIQAFDSRQNLFVGLILNGLILWDMQCLQRFRRWKNESADQLPGWLDTIGLVDSLISLSNHAYNNPDFVFPQLADGNPVIEGKGIGHPLIDEKSRICNDFFAGRKGCICIITGANMAGKSTFLRTIAVNMILGMSGTTVCASEFRFTPSVLYTSMRTMDSLNNKESYFYAELKRLKKLKEKLEEGEEIFFILDEILKGTNSGDKSAGSKMFLGKLASLGGTGLIATHDISLGEMEHEMPGRIINKCFETEIDGENLIFDYKLRDGITRRMNAAILMRQMGII